MHCTKPERCLISVRWFRASFTSLHVSEERRGPGSLLWPQMLSRKFSQWRKRRWRFIMSCFTLQNPSVAGWCCQLPETTDLRELCSSLLTLSMRAQPCLSLPCFIQETVPGISSLLLSPLLQPIRAGRREPDMILLWGETPSPGASLWWGVNGVISSPAPPTVHFPGCLSYRWHNWTWTESAAELRVWTTVLSAWLVLRS